MTTRTTPRRRGHLPHMSMTPRRGETIPPLTDGLTAEETDVLRRAADRERQAETSAQAWSRARWLAAGIKRAADAAEATRARNARRRELLANAPALAAQRQAETARRTTPGQCPSAMERALRAFDRAGDRDSLRWR